MLRRYHRRRKETIEKLGGQCAQCGSADSLQIDHIDPATKEYDVGRGLAGLAAVKLEEEVKKCQLLCTPCHTGKSILDAGNKPAKGTHGTLSSYRYCKCDLCRAANARWSREYKRRRKKKDS